MVGIIELMIIAMHVALALMSIIFTTILYFAPSQNKFKAAYILVGGTLLTGTYLVISRHSALLGACVSGVIYLTIVTIGIAAAAYKYSANK